MDSEWVNTSLGLNVIPFHPASDDQAPVKVSFVSGALYLVWGLLLAN